MDQSRPRRANAGGGGQSAGAPAPPARQDVAGASSPWDEYRAARDATTSWDVNRVKKERRIFAAALCEASRRLVAPKTLSECAEAAGLRGDEIANVWTATTKTTKTTTTTATATAAATTTPEVMRGTPRTPSGAHLAAVEARRGRERDRRRRRGRALAGECKKRRSSWTSETRAKDCRGGYDRRRAHAREGRRVGRRADD